MHGCVGNNAAVMPMQFHCLTVVAAPTTLLSNLPHSSTMRGRILDVDLVTNLLRGVEERGLAESSAAILTGFLGSSANGEMVADFVGRAKRRNPDLFYILDPVAGDGDIGAFACPELIDVFRHKLMPLANIVTPNRRELRRQAASSRHDADLSLARQLMQQGPRCVVVTGGTTTGEELTTLVLEPACAWAIRSPRVDARPAGTGDLFTGQFTARILSGDGAVAAAGYAVSACFGIIQRTSLTLWSELPVAGSIAELATSTRSFPPIAIRGARQVEYPEP